MNNRYLVERSMFNKKWRLSIFWAKVRVTLPLSIIVFGAVFPLQFLLFKTKSIYMASCFEGNYFEYEY